MRNQNGWCKALVSMFPKAERDSEVLTMMAKVELGLRLLEKLGGGQPATAVWTLLGGYPFAQSAGLSGDSAAEWLLTCARHRLWTMRRRRTWNEALRFYANLPAPLRAYQLDEDLRVVRPLRPTVAGGRFNLYDTELTTLPPYSDARLDLARPGPHRVFDRRRLTRLTIPDVFEFAAEDRIGYDLQQGRAGTGDPLEIQLDELGLIADRIDELGLSGHGLWRDRFKDLHLDQRRPGESKFRPTRTLRVDRLLHLVGMVGAGKSTLMILVAVWAADHELTTTLVVGDVAEQLRVTALLREILGDDAAAPVLGSSTREQHVARLHRRLAAKGRSTLLRHIDEQGFHDLSTACPADALRDGPRTSWPLRFIDAPCVGLFAQEHEGDEDQDDRLGTALGCPLWYSCPRHSAARELVTAKVWVANPASLVQTRVPAHLVSERVRYLELACLRSDIMIVDEADRVMANFDIMFAPSATLVTKGPESWLDQLNTHKIGELAREGRLQLSDPEVARWEVSLTVVGSATNRLYEMLISNAELRTWVGIEYFSSWTLQERLLEGWYPERPLRRGTPIPSLDEDYEYELDCASAADEDDSDRQEETAWHLRRKEVAAALDDFRDDPLGDQGPHGPMTRALTGAVQDLLHTVNLAGARTRTRAVLDLLLAGSPAITGELPDPEPEEGKELEPADRYATPEWYARTVVRLEFTLLLGVLHQRLDRLTLLWPHVEASLRLERTSNELVRRPPSDYSPIIPESPMGNVLGFQYLPDHGARELDPQGRLTGTLRFFQCAGVGRELLLSLPELGQDFHLGRYGPHVVLMSGTSWAGTSTKSHVLTPVRAVLGPREEFLAAVRETKFTTRFLYDEQNRPLSLSGQRPDVRPALLRKVIGQLAKRPPGKRFSPLEEELDSVKGLDRRRALLLVGSYADAVLAANHLDEVDGRWKGRVRVLMPDDELSRRTSNGTAGVIGVRRGDVADFAKDDTAEILIAPLMAIERGHNILNSEYKAAFGTVLFLVRPHPRPDDLALSVFAINDWASRYTRGLGRADTEYETFDNLVAKHDDLDQAGKAFRRLGRKEWYRLLTRQYIYPRLTKREKESFAWDQLVTMWQVIGRLVRGGVPARVVFVDAKFAPRAAAASAPGADLKTISRRDTVSTSLLVNLREVLKPYFDDDRASAPSEDPADAGLVQRLYRPLYDALCAMPEIG